MAYPIGFYNLSTPMSRAIGMTGAQLAKKKYDKHLKDLGSHIANNEGTVKDLGNGNKKLFYIKEDSSGIRKWVRVYEYNDSGEKINLKSVSNFYFIDGKKQTKTLRWKTRDKDGRIIQNEIKKPTNKLTFGHGANGSLTMKETEPDDSEIEAAKEAEVEPETEAPSAAPEAAPEAPPSAPPAAPTGGSSSGATAPAAPATSPSAAPETPPSAPPAAPTGGSSSGATAPAAPAGPTDPRSLGTGAADFRDIVEIKIVDNRDADKKGKYNAGDKIQLKASVKPGKAIPSNGLDGSILFKGTDGTVIKVPITVFDENNFEATIPGDIKAGDYRIIPANKDGSQEGNPIGDKVNITAAGTAPVAGAGATGGFQAIEFDEPPVEFIVDGRVIADPTKWKVKPGKSVKIRIKLKNPPPEDLRVWAFLTKDGSEAIPETEKTIKGGKNGDKTVEVSIFIPENYKTGDTTLTFIVNPYQQNGVKTTERSHIDSNYNQILNKAFAENINTISHAITINIDKSAFDIGTKKITLTSGKREYNALTRRWTNKPADFNLPTFPDGEADKNSLGGWYLKTKFGPEDTEDFNIGLCYHKNPVNCESSSALLTFATESVLPQRTGFNGMSIIGAPRLIDDPPIIDCADGSKIENKAYEMECTDRNGSTYTVRIHTDIERGNFGVNDTNITIQIVENSKPTKSKDGVKGISKASEKNMVSAWDKLHKAKGKIEEIIPEKPAAAPAPPSK